VALRGPLDQRLENRPMGSAELVRLAPLLELTSGRPEVVIGLLDGPVAISHPDLAAACIREVPRGVPCTCTDLGSAACAHGTFVAGILCARRGSAAPAICPGCTLLVRPIYQETPRGDGQLPSATAEQLAAAIVECVEAGARVLNVSSAFAQPSTKGERELEQALDHAARRGAVVVAAAGNQGTLGSSAITRHSGVIPVAACDIRGQPIAQSNLGRSIGRRGLLAPGASVTSLGTAGGPLTSGGTSVAAPFVTGAIALVWSEFPKATASEVRFAVTQGHTPRRPMIVPPLLDAWAAYRAMAAAHARR